MKNESYFLVSDRVKENVIARIKEIPPSGRVKVSISDAGSKSTKQRGLQWLWYSEVAKAGVGGKYEDTKEGVHLASKWRFGIPILMRDDEFFRDLWEAWAAKYHMDEERLRWFVESQVHTEKFNTSQMAEFLTEFQRHYAPIAALTDPSEKGLLDAVKR